MFILVLYHKDHLNIYLQYFKYVSQYFFNRYNLQFYYIRIFLLSHLCSHIHFNIFIYRSKLFIIVKKILVKILNLFKMLKLDQNYSNAVIVIFVKTIQMLDQNYLEMLQLDENWSNLVKTALTLL